MLTYLKTVLHLGSIKNFSVYFILCLYFPLKRKKKSDFSNELQTHLFQNVAPPSISFSGIHACLFNNIKVFCNISLSVSCYDLCFIYTSSFSMKL